MLSVCTLNIAVVSLFDSIKITLIYLPEKQELFQPKLTVTSSLSTCQNPTAFSYPNDLPLIFLTAKSRQEVAARMAILGLKVAYIPKPFSPSALVQKVADVLDGKGWL